MGLPPPSAARILTASHEFRRATAAAAFELWQMPTAEPRRKIRLGWWLNHENLGFLRQKYGDFIGI
jgi:hypothetical protein